MKNRYFSLSWPITNESLAWSWSDKQFCLEIQVLIQVIASRMQPDQVLITNVVLISYVNIHICALVT